MTKERQSRFRSGENPNRPYGGHISDEPLPKALYNAAVSMGYESQRALASALGVDSGTVGYWYRGEKIPSPRVFGDLLILLDLNDEEKEPLVEAYANRLARKEASMG